MKCARSIRGALGPIHSAMVSDEIEPTRSDDDLLPYQDLPFQDLVAPEPIDAAPPTQARWLAFSAILIGGLLGALVGFGVGDLMGGSTGATFGAVIGGLTGAIGVGTLANLTLRAMNEWRSVEHPEAGTGENNQKDSEPENHPENDPEDHPEDHPEKGE